MTQYPLESTKEDFWRMVWDRNSPVIIVLQSEDEEVSPCASLYFGLLGSGLLTGLLSIYSASGFWW